MYLCLSLRYRELCNELLRSRATPRLFRGIGRRRRGRIVLRPRSALFSEEAGLMTSSVEKSETAKFWNEISRAFRRKKKKLPADAKTIEGTLVQHSPDFFPRPLHFCEKLIGHGAINTGVQAPKRSVREELKNPDRKIVTQRRYAHAMQMSLRGPLYFLFFSFPYSSSSSSASPVVRACEQTRPAKNSAPR